MSEESVRAAEGEVEKKSRIDEWKAYFLSHGLTASDLAKAILVHEAVGMSWFAGSWGICYAVQVELVDDCGLMIDFAAHPQDGIELLPAAHRLLLRQSVHVTVPLVRSLDKQRAVMSLAESSILRNAARPATVPLKLWIAVQVVLMTKKRPGSE